MALDLLENPVFTGYIFYATIVIVKMMLMSVLTAKQRFGKGAFANPEDVKGQFGKRTDKKPILTDPDVERVRRIHLNDIENIIPFVLIGFFYSLTSPPLKVALWHFRLFAGARILHTLCYQIPIPQPSRALTWFIGYAVTFSMAFFVIKATGAF